MLNVITHSIESKREKQEKILLCTPQNPLPSLPLSFITSGGKGEGAVPPVTAGNF